ncbi:MAG: hypothetical protein D6739_05405, partial [Nitrospirae bacterium]
LAPSTLLASVPLAATVVALSAVAFPAQAGTTALDRATRALVAAQGDFGDFKRTWSWRPGDARPAPNAAGLVAAALVRTYRRTGDGRALEAARAWAEARAGELDRWAPVYDGDVEALVALYRATGEARYARLAARAFETRWGGATPRETFAYVVQHRAAAPELVLYDVALILRAAAGVGRTAYAHALAEQAIAFDEAHPKLSGVWAETSRAALADALLWLDARRYEAAIGRLAARLIRAIDEAGHVAGSVQATAYAVRALARIDDAPAQRAARQARRWLEAQQAPDGTWSQKGERPHALTAEVAVALAQGQP